MNSVKILIILNISDHILQCILVSEEDEEATIVEPSKRGRCSLKVIVSDVHVTPVKSLDLQLLM